MRYCGLILISVIGLSTGAAPAAPITFEFTGTITQVPIDEVFLDVVEGSSITGLFTFNSLAADGVPDSTTGSYAMLGPPYIFSVNVGGHDFSISESLNVSVFDSLVDQYSVFAQTAGADLSLTIFLQDNTATAFGNDLLPLAPPPLGSFTLADFHLTATIGNGQVQFDGIIETLQSETVQPVPEPGSIYLMWAGVAVWGAARLARRDRRTVN